MDITLARRRVDQLIERQHRAGRRCPECAPRGGCLRLLAAVHRRLDRAATARIPTGLRRLV
ncbi:hypothetical protein ACN28C_13485 [Plantactinospora sp. WMMC1484]|uniref:hypothetical protein n=1 Tax=Plantactinospora sp. WMMC1484 TaxID=3404122 RepID=UPI003BF59DA8